MKTQGLKVRLIAAGILIATIPLVAASLVMWHHMLQIKSQISSSVLSLSSADYTHLAQSIYDEAQVAHHSLNEELQRGLKTAETEYSQIGPLKLSRDEQVNWTIINESDGSEKIISLPKAYLGDVALDQVTDPSLQAPVVDDVQHATGHFSTLFQRINDNGDMMRIASSFVGNDGKRIIGTTLPATLKNGAPNPVITSVLKGKVYQGRVFVAGQWFWAAYKPITDETGKAIGIIGVGVAEKHVTMEMLKLIVKRKIGRDGYIFIVNTKGDSRGHYVLSRNRERDGEDIYNSRDSSGRLFIKSMVDHSLIMKPGEVGIERYPWQNPGDPAPRQKLAHFVYFEPWDWLIGVTIYEDEYMSMVREAEGLIENSLQFQLILIATTLLLASICFYFIFKRISDEQSQMQLMLSHSQKLESVGQLAAGVAHEINTPMQYINDNTQFLQKCLNDIIPILKSHRKLLQFCEDHSASGKVVQEAKAVVQNIDLEYLLDESQQAAKQTLEGIDRVIQIVKAMKDFSHPGEDTKVPLDLNRAIETTLAVARGEWKYIADVKTDFDENLTPVLCLPSEFNQLILNILINAAQAIKEVVDSDKNKRGTITICTKQIDQMAEIRISDTGPGIPEKIRTKIFDPFFTTKPVGIGTGQGLSISRAIVVHRLHGSIEFETVMGNGTTFIILLPIEP